VLAKFISMKRRNGADKLPILFGVDTIGRVEPSNQVNEGRGARIKLTDGIGFEVEESIADIKDLIDQV
jgi:hypothetical protein